MQPDPGPDPGDEQVRAWRRDQRAALIARRAAVPAGERGAWNACITARLLAIVGVPPGAVIGLCWPYRGEFDARHALRDWRANGVVGALPEVVDRRSPLRFRRWWPGAPMRPGVYDIPVPDGTPVVVPDIAIVPMNAFDGCGYRLGYGAGYFDRTLAAHRMLAIGVAYEMLRLPTIHPRSHDIPMDLVVTEEAIYRAGGVCLAPLDDGQAREDVQRILAGRRLPRVCFANPREDSG